MKYKQLFLNVILLISILSVAFGISLFIHYVFDNELLIPAIFVLSVFMISLTTKGYVCGVIASILSVFIINYAFTFPYFQFALHMRVIEGFLSVVIMLVITIMTSMLTTKIKNQEAEKLLIEKEKVRANLLRSISHDIRTPLTSIYGSCQALIDNYNSIEKEEKIKLLNEMSEDSRWLIRMVENLLSITKIDSDVKVKKSEIVLEELVSSVLIKFKKKYNQVIDVSIPEEFLLVPMDATLIEQVIINLFENAMIHAKGMTKLSLVVYVDNKKVIFEVTDDGCGFVENEKVEYLDDKRGNMGIGLSLCKTIINAHGGSIDIISKENFGTTIKFSLDLED